jgi:hypothetical protein
MNAFFVSHDDVGAVSRFPSVAEKLKNTLKM